MRESRRITRKSASNLALAFAVLPRERREAMAVLYAFCREVDDVADEDALPVELRRAELKHWREDVRRVYKQATPELAVNRELQSVIRRYPLSLDHFEELLDGVEMDLEKHRYASWEQLDLYCYRVASVVGLLSIEIFGYKNPVCKDYAVHLGRALQLTNILRDVRNDALRGRIYIPDSDLGRFGVTPEDIFEGRWSPAYCNLASSVAARAIEHYTVARRILPAEDRESMVASELMGAVYWRLLLKLQAAEFNVFTDQPVRLSKPQKLSLVASSYLRFVFTRRTPVYGPA